MQCTNDVLLVRPVGFAFNSETAKTNTFQNDTEESGALREKALNEFAAFSETLRSAGITVNVVDDTESPSKPDAVFPNNWISFHSDGTVITYPMCAPNRRLEKRDEIVKILSEKYKFKRFINLSHYEQQNKFLEGTGSVVFDHKNRIAYACLSPRTDRDILLHLCEIVGYTPVWFYAYADGNEIYHTNVMMSVGDAFAVVCLDSISDASERQKVIESLHKSGHQIVDISISQMKKFAGNMLCLKSENGKNLLAMSQSAYDSLTLKQRDALERYCQLFPLSVHAIERAGGGSVRCMIAEIFSERK